MLSKGDPKHANHDWGHSRSIKPLGLKNKGKKEFSYERNTHVLLRLGVGESVWVLRRRGSGNLGDAWRLRMRLTRVEKVVQRLRDAAVTVQPTENE